MGELEKLPRIFAYVDLCQWASGTIAEDSIPDMLSSQTCVHYHLASLPAQTLPALTYRKGNLNKLHSFTMGVWSVLYFRFRRCLRRRSRQKITTVHKNRTLGGLLLKQKSRNGLKLDETMSVRGEGETPASPSLYLWHLELNGEPPCSLHHHC